MLQVAPFSDLGVLEDVDVDVDVLSPLSFHLSIPDGERQQEPDISKRPAKKRQTSASEREKGSDGSKDPPRMLACLNCRHKKIKVCQYSQ